MKIAQVAPLFESVPPQYYGGTERIVSYLTSSIFISTTCTFPCRYGSVSHT